jgi:hypothetical protein
MQLGKEANLYAPTTILAGLIAPVIFAVLYIRLARPGLAAKGAKPGAFLLVSMACFLTATVAIARGVFALAHHVLAVDATSAGEDQTLVVVLVASSLIAIGAVIAPNFVIRLTGGCDPSIPLRYLLDIFGARWRAAASDLESEDAALRFLASSLHSRDLGDRIAEWMTAHNSTERSQVNAFRARIVEVLASNEAFDPISWFRTARWRSERRRWS